MKKSNLILIAVLLAAGAFGAAFGLTQLSRSIAAEKQEKASFVSTWTNQAAGLVVEFTSDGQFKISGTTAAEYTIDTDNKTVTFVYDQTYGGQTVTMTYTLSQDNNTLTLVNSTDGTTYAYVRGGEVTSTVDPNAASQQTTDTTAVQ